MVFAVVSKWKLRIVKLNWSLKYCCHISLFIGIQDNIDQNNDNGNYKKKIVAGPVKMLAGQVEIWTGLDRASRKNP